MKDLGQKEGAIRLLTEAMKIDKNNRLTILSHECKREVASHALSAANDLAMKDIIFVEIPEIIRPLKHLPRPLLGAMDQSDGLVYFASRMQEEAYTFNDPLLSRCKEKNLTLCYLYDPQIRYFEEGIAADYETVQGKCSKVAKILAESEEIQVESDLGTSLTFSVYKKVLPRGPVISPEMRQIQAPEGEVMSVPVETSFNGKLVVDHTVTKAGIPPSPVAWTFHKGQATKVEGDELFLSNLLNSLKGSDERVRSLKGIWIAEFALGTNDWCVLDDNISNCEKVAGTLHFGMGQEENKIGVDRGERYHFDSMVTNAAVTVKGKDGTKRLITEKGRLLI